MADKFTTWWLQIMNKSVDMGNPHGCRLWQGYTTPLGYGRKRVTLPDGTSKQIMVSRVVYMCREQTFDIREHDDSGEKLEMSHLCHHKLCVRQNHLVLEPHSVNMERQHCFHQGLCTGAHEPNCLI